MAMLALGPHVASCRPLPVLSMAPFRPTRRASLPNSKLGSHFLRGVALKLPSQSPTVSFSPSARSVAVRASVNTVVPHTLGYQSLYIAVGIPVLLGFVDSLFNSPAQQWYFDLKKPKWQPPGPVFGGAWSILYPLMGLASWLVWAEGGFAKQAVPLTLYAVQLGLNLAWQALFFGSKRLGAAFYDIVALDLVLLVTIVKFQSVNAVAANLLKPYLAWVLFATALSWRLWDLNRDLTAGTSDPPPASPAASSTY